MAAAQAGTGVYGVQLEWSQASVVSSVADGLATQSGLIWSTGSKSIAYSLSRSFMTIGTQESTIGYVTTNAVGADFQLGITAATITDSQGAAYAVNLECNVDCTAPANGVSVRLGAP